MRPILAITALAVPCLLTAAHASDAIASGQKGHWECRSVPPIGTVYVSAIWDGDVAPHLVQASFQKMLREKYGYSGNASCSIATLAGSTLVKVQDGQKSYIAQLRAAGTKVIETGWTYSSAQSLTYLCSGTVSVAQGNQATYYFYVSPFIEVAAGDDVPLQTAWIAYLGTLHPGAYVLPSGCQVVPANLGRAEFEERIMTQVKPAKAKGHSRRLEVHSHRCCGSFAT